MKIGISSEGKDLSSQIDQRFGRCKFFLIVDSETKDFKTISNESSFASGGAGIKAAQTIANEEVKVVITGNMGPNAFQTLNAAGIKVFTGANGTINEVLESYQNGKLIETKAPNVDSHSGMGGN